MKKRKLGNPVYLYEFTVQGHGEFAFDMLRYDCCWPKTEAEDSIALGVGLHPTSRERFSEQRQVTLLGLRPPTSARWSSFGWKVIEGR